MKFQRRTSSPPGTSPAAQETTGRRARAVSGGTGGGFTGLPPFLLGATVLFWGWQTGLLWLGGCIAVLLESARWLPTRWEFTQADLDRIWNLCVLLGFASLVVAFASNDGFSTLTTLLESQSLAARSQALSKNARSAFLVFEWMPLTMLPIVLAQAFGDQSRIEWSTFSWRLRRLRSLRRPMIPGSGLNVGWAYFTVCLLAASAANERTLRFPLGLSVLVLWALWSQRRRGGSRLGAVCSLLAAFGLAFVTQNGMRELQGVMQRLDAALVARFGGGSSSGERELRTMLGSVGHLKLSGDIVMRVETDGQPPPPRLREVTYNLFRSPIWATPKQEHDNFHQVTAETNITTTILLPRTAANRTVTISGYYSADDKILALPNGTVRLDELNADVDTNGMGIVRLRPPIPGFARFEVSYQDGRSIDTAPGPDDRDVPSVEKPAIQEIARQLRLQDLKTPEERIQAISRFFVQHFEYSTWIGRDQRPSSNQTALSRFLLKTRSGHCEYFATATTLLLRAANIPARYAVGFAVQERKGDRWIIRERHAHAWALAYLNGAWHDVDTTPGTWIATEDARGSWWENISDAFSDVWYHFSKWRWGNSEWKQYLVWALAPLLGLTAWRLMAYKQWSRSKSKTAATGLALVRPGLDSEFFAIQEALARAGLERLAGETASAWLQRLERDRLASTTQLQPLLALHYRLRFDPHGLPTGHRSELRQAAQAWVETHPAR